MELPRRLTLPSGISVRIDGSKALPKQAEPERALSAALAWLEVEGTLVREDGAPLDVRELTLRDAHVLLALVFKARIVDEPVVERRCDNCDRILEVLPSSSVEEGPFVDGELGDAELDAPFDFAKSFSIAPVFTASGTARSVRLAPRTLGDAALLFEPRSRELRLSRAVVMALGIAALGKERKAAGIARALARASDDAWTALGEIWESAHYSPRLWAGVFCECGARNEVPAPSVRVFDAVAAAAEDGAHGEGEGDMSLEEFEEEAERARRSVYAARRVRNIPLIVEAGVPDCDEGGEPLLGSYTPAQSSPGQELPEIRLYFRSFQSDKRLDPTFDIKAEIRETIDHEVEHHLFHLSGHDPMDEEERAVIARERERMIGRKELERRGVHAFSQDLLGFLKVGLPLLAILVFAAILQHCLN